MYQDVAQPTQESNVNWIQTYISRIKSLPEGERLELIVPTEIDHIGLIAAIGQDEKQEAEYGGLFNQKTRSLVVIKGFRTQGNNPHVEFVSTRRNDDGISTDDIFWHTHPWSSKSPIGYFRKPENACQPSDTDTNNLLALQMVEEEAGNTQPVISITTSGGYVTISEAKGITADRSKLEQLGISRDRIENIMTTLALEPDECFLRAARDDSAKQELKKLLDQFYLDRRFDKSRPPKQKIKDFIQQAKKYTFDQNRRGIEENTVEWLAEVYYHFPKLPGNLDDLTTEQSNAVLEMTGFSARTYKA